MKPLIYIAGPYTAPDPAINVRNAMNAAHEIIELGGIPVCPHLSHFLHMHTPRPYETWMEIDLALLVKCDAIWRIPGRSPGADHEVKHAQTCNIPVLNSYRDLVEFIHLRA